MSQPKEFSKPLVKETKNEDDSDDDENVKLSYPSPGEIIPIDYGKLSTLEKIPVDARIYAQNRIRLLELLEEDSEMRSNYMDFILGAIAISTLIFGLVMIFISR